MTEVTLHNGRKCVVGKFGITVGSTVVTWVDLCDAVDAASTCFPGGTKAESDLIQVTVDYLPTLKKRMEKPL